MLWIDSFRTFIPLKYFIKEYEHCHIHKSATTISEFSESIKISLALYENDENVLISLLYFPNTISKKKLLWSWMIK